MLAKNIRPRAFAGLELFLDAVHVAREHVGGDIETVMIYFSVAEATMHPLMTRKDLPDNIRRAAVPPDAYRGSISRGQIAERTGLPRETVRRKVNAMIKSGAVVETAKGELRTLPNLAEARSQQAVRDMFGVARRYHLRLREFGCPGVDGMPVE